MKIAMDCLGADRSPDANLEGSVRALSRFDDIDMIFLGDEKIIKEKLENLSCPMHRVEIVHAPDVVTGEDRPLDAVRIKKDSSMIRGIRMLREDPAVDAFVTAGATGTLVSAATLRIGRIDGVRRPAFCPLLPTMSRAFVAVCDSGANVDCTPLQLQQYAIMGSVYLSAAYGIETPRVALLNVGTESEKGDELRREAYALLQHTKGVNFVGNMESRDLISGKYDLVVCDGFSGNVLIKSTEGTALELLKLLKKDIYSKWTYKLGALFMKKMFMEEKEFLNYQNYGGSVLLGCEKVIVKGHGSSNAVAINKCVEQARSMVNGSMKEKIARLLKENEPQQEVNTNV